MNAMVVYVMAAEGIFAGFINGWYYDDPHNTLVYLHRIVSLLFTSTCPVTTPQYVQIMGSKMILDPNGRGILVVPPIVCMKTFHNFFQTGLRVQICSMFLDFIEVLLFLRRFFFFLVFCSLSPVLFWFPKLLQIFLSDGHKLVKVRNKLAVSKTCQNSIGEGLFHAAIFSPPLIHAAMHLQIFSPNKHPLFMLVDST